MCTMTASFWTLCVLSVCLSFVFCSELEIRGLQPRNLKFYDPNRDFKCIDGSLIIPFSQVNDDYCDCSDGSDEPGTSACPSGQFYCTNLGYTPRVIPSNRVNDGICDCCDGADEYGGRTQCTNLCDQLGALLREEEVRQHKLKMEGHEIYLAYVTEGREARTTKQARLEELQRERDDVDMKRAELEKRKTELEQPEKEAKERHEQAWEASKETRQAEKRVVLAKEAFYSLDANHDNLVTIEELQAHSEFDIDSNGEVATDEAKEYLEENEEVTFDVFLDKIWDNIREIYRRPGEIPPPSPPADDSSPPDTSPDDEAEDKELSDAVARDESEPDRTDDRDTEDDYNDDDEEEDDRDELADSEDGDVDDDGDDRDYDNAKKKPAAVEKKPGDDEDDKMPDYDEHTKYLISVADEARQDYNAMDTKFRDIENEINGLKKVLDQDLGQNGEFFPLMDKCFDFNDREYTYSLCPFDRAAQRSKSGGSETSLGRWGMWAGPADYIYAVMKYEHGQNCWNGPDRSAKVHVQCGLTNELVSVTEPNRCEYRFVFNTPAACSQPPEPNANLPRHVEL